MRTPSPSSTVVSIAPRAPGSAFPRRRIAPMFGHLTCLVLVKHRETEKALFVSDDGDPVGAVWLPKMLVSIEGGAAASGKFIVATMSKHLADEKRLYPRFIDKSRFLPEEIETLEHAQALAARSRNRLRGYRDPMGWSGGRNVFA